ncbi:MAG: putative glutamate transporter glutamate-binding protein [Pseudonocardiales bacterium]|nr:putative glutamate transporter glutamate-binding protein [Pseudonocardiales bacterium]
MGKFRSIGAGLLAVGMTLTLAACSSRDSGSAGSDVDPSTGGGSSSASTATGVVGKAANSKKLTVGIKFDQPGLGLKTPSGGYAGFDVEVAKYVAKKLGVPESGIEFVEAKSAARENLIETGQVDLIFATYSITAKRQAIVDFGGPYFIAHQDLLVRNSETTITGPDSLTDGKKLCSVTGSTSAQTVKDKYAAGVQLQEYSKYSDCVDALTNSAIDAVTTDDVILAGYAAQSQYKGKLKVVGKGFTDEKYGVGLKKGDATGVTAINKALAEMISDGSWKKALESTVGPSGYTIPTPPTPGTI